MSSALRSFRSRSRCPWRRRRAHRREGPNMAEITRRAVMAGMGAVAAAAGVTAARAAVPLDADMTGQLVPNDDAELFDLWQERQSEVADWEAICEREPPNGPRKDRKSTRLNSSH